MVTRVDISQDFISADKTQAISGHGEHLKIGDRVEHDDKSAGQAVIQSFELDEKDGSVKVHTDKGWAHAAFVYKVKQ